MSLFTQPSRLYQTAIQSNGDLYDLEVNHWESLCREWAAWQSCDEWLWRKFWHPWWTGLCYTIVYHLRARGSSFLLLAQGTRELRCENKKRNTFIQESDQRWYEAQSQAGIMGCAASTPRVEESEKAQGPKIKRKGDSFTPVVAKADPLDAVAKASQSGDHELVSYKTNDRKFDSGEAVLEASIEKIPARGKLCLGIQGSWGSGVILLYTNRMSVLLTTWCIYHLAVTFLPNSMTWQALAGPNSRISLAWSFLV